MYLNPEKNYISAFNNPSGQKFFKECIPDLYSETHKEALFFNGCFFHGHYENCLLNKTAVANSKNFQNKTYETLNKEFEEKLQKLLKNNPEIKSVTYEWECNFRQRRKSPNYQKFLKNIFKPHPLMRLNPRICIRGAFSDVYRLKWHKNEAINEAMYYIDINGLYSYCAVSFKYMCDRYEILIGDKINNIKVQNNQFYYLDTKIYGTMLVTILPPKKLFKPFLLYRTSDNRVVNTLCRTCAEKQQKRCTHVDNDRALISSYFISEIEFALTLGYSLISVHECHCYYNADFILKDFVKFLSFQKIRHSNILKFCRTKDEKNQYLDYLNKRMDFTNYKLNLTNVSVNEQKKQFYKYMANSFFGKFQQKRNKTQSIFVANQNQLEETYFAEDKNIVDIFCFNDEFCQLLIEKNVLKLPPNRMYNCYIGGQICAYARQVIYNHLEIIEKNNGTLYYVDCDSVIFSLPKSQKLPVVISDALGDFKNEIFGEILSFYSLGPKNYTIIYKAENETKKLLTKIKGLSLRNIAFQNEINEDIYRSFVESNKIESTSVLQIRKTKSRIAPKFQNFTFSNHLTPKRLLLNKQLYITYPYGFHINS
jgi:hypothetical protein